MPDTYRKLAEDAIDALENGLDELNSSFHAHLDELRDRLHALDEAGPYGWAIDSELAATRNTIVAPPRGREACPSMGAGWGSGAPHPPPRRHPRGG